MDTLTIDNRNNGNEAVEATVDQASPFIESNTIECDLAEIQQNHIIPVFVKDNEPLISHSDFIKSVMEVAGWQFGSLTVSEPSIRVSHPIKGRVPEARNKPANQLLEHEKTLYYERMAFMIQINDITGLVNGQRLALTLGGVKAYCEDNLGKSKGYGEHFRFFIGFRNVVCTNLCISTDGYSGLFQVNSVQQLMEQVQKVIQAYGIDQHLDLLADLPEKSLSEQQFAQLIGRCRMYQFLPTGIKESIPNLEITDSQINKITDGYYNDIHFKSNGAGEVDLWNLYNLITGANRSSYINLFLDRSVNCMEFIEMVSKSLDGDNCWFLN